MASQPKKVFVAMSGGVDSSVAAALLKKQNFEVVGVFMKPWSPNESNSSFCLWQRDKEDAMKVASVLDIPLLTWDFSKEYKKQVTDYMIREYKAGRTPNPDVMCNKEIKFGLFLKKALKEGADYIATGHYVRLRRNDQFRISNFESISNSKIKNSNIYSKLKIRNSKFSLWQAKDKNKDQSYFLWTLTQKQLRYCLFPIGDYTKPKVRRMAKKFGLPTADKKDSQGICFIGPLNIKEFLKKHIKPKKGKILDINGNLIGNHDGVFYYTIGQRHGLNITNGKGPYFVVKKDIKRNIVYIGKKNDLGEKIAKVGNISWVNDQPKLPAQIEVQIRYRSKSERATLFKDGSLKFKNLTRAVTPGQSAVFYLPREQAGKGKELLGGGIVK